MGLPMQCVRLSAGGQDVQPVVKRLHAWVLTQPPAATTAGGAAIAAVADALWQSYLTTILPNSTQSVAR